MADIKACDLTEPHRRHNWQDSHPYDGFVPHMVPSYHVCPGVTRSEEDLEKRANALARARHREERTKLRHLELGLTLEEHYRHAYTDITTAEEVLKETEAALKAEEGSE